MMAHTLRGFDAARFQACARRCHEAPEILHRDDAFDGPPDGLGVGSRTERLPGPFNRLAVYEVGAASVPHAPRGHFPHRRMLSPIQAYLNCSDVEGHKLQRSTRQLPQGLHTDWPGIAAPSPASTVNN